MVILEPDGTLSHTEAIDLVDHQADETLMQHHSDQHSSADVGHQAYDVFGLSEVAREIEQAAARVSSELHQLAAVNELALLHHGLPLFQMPAFKVR
jgi:hypothetical protein